MARSPSDNRDSQQTSSSEDGLILTAIMNNDKHLLMDLLAQGCSSTEEELSRPLELAINLENLEMVRVLLRYGACMKSTLCTLNPTALQCAVLNRQKPMIRQLLANKVDASRCDGNGATVLHMVFELEETSGMEEEDDEDDDGEPRSKMARSELSPEQEIIEIITMLLATGCQLNAEMNTGETALFLALKKGMIEVAGFLIERGANVHVRDHMGNSLIHLLIEDEVEEAQQQQQPETFVQKNNATFISWLLSKGVNANYKNARGEMPLQLAIEYKLRDTLLVLLKHANVYYVNEEAEGWLHVFVKMYQSLGSGEEDEDFLTRADINEAVRELVRRGAPVNAVDCYGQTLFHAAIQLRNSAILKAIAVGFVNVLACNSEGETVLHALVSRCIDDERPQEEGYAEVARLLLAKGASPGRKDKRGISALHLAAQYKYARIVRAFAEAADLRVCTDDGASLLHIAARRLSSLEDEQADRALVDLALAAGCSPDQREPRAGWTPLHVAVTSGNVATARRLLEHGARAHLPDLHGRTPLQCALLSNCTVGFYLLLRLGLRPEHDLPDDLCALVLANREMSSYVISHLAKLQAADLTLPPGLARAFGAGASSDLPLSHGAEKYKQEVEALKCRAIERGVSLYDLLHMRPEHRFDYLADKNLDLADLETRFPHYYGFLWRLVFEARERKLILQPARRALNELSKKVCLPDSCVHYIFNILTNDCLKNIIDAAN